MSISEIVLIGIALSMDAFAVCVASSMVYTNMTWLRKLSMPIMFGLFQGIMPILGFFLGSFSHRLLKNGQDRFHCLFSV